MAYNHTQKSPLDDLLFAVAAAAVLSAWAFRYEPVVMWLLLGIALLMGLAGLCFGHLTVCDEGERLAIRYGPLPVFHMYVAYSKISAVEPARSSLIDGLGIHWVPGRGRTYNLWGVDCVKLSSDGRIIRVGSDDVASLTKFLESRIMRPA